MKKVIVYIDGLNLYYALKETQYKWLDLGAFADNLMKTRQKKYDVIAIKYFTSKVIAKPAKEAGGAVMRQKNYLNALEIHVSKLEIIEGKFSCRTKWAITKKGDEVEIFNIEEKQTDVNLAVTMVKDALCQSHDCVLLVSNDSDFTGALKIVKEYKEVVLFNPREVEGEKDLKNAKDLKNHAHDVIDVYREQLFASSQLPSTIQDKRTGKLIKKPALW